MDSLAYGNVFGANSNPNGPQMVGSEEAVNQIIYKATTFS